MNANAEIIAELRRVLNERDEAREQLDLTKRELGRWVDRETKAVRERDEARAEVERLRETKDYLRTWLSSEELEGLRVKAAEHPLLWEEIHHWKAEVERLRSVLSATSQELADIAATPAEERALALEMELAVARAERDEARADFARSVAAWESAGMQGRTAHDAMLALAKERDEARADADRWKRSCNVFRERDWPKAFQATVTSLEQEVSDAHEQLAKLRKLSKPWEGDAYRRGAEAMREACVNVVLAELSDPWYSDELLGPMRALPIPEEP